MKLMLFVFLMYANFALAQTDAVKSLQGMWSAKTKTINADGSAAKDAAGETVHMIDVLIRVTPDTMYLQSVQRPGDRLAPFRHALPLDSLTVTPAGFDVTYRTGSNRREHWSFVLIAQGAWRAMRDFQTSDRRGKKLEALSGIEGFEARQQPDILRRLEGVWDEQWSLSNTFEPQTVATQVRKYLVSHDTVYVSIEDEIGNFNEVMRVPMDDIVVGPKGFVWTFRDPDPNADRRKLTFTNVTPESWSGRMDITKVSKGGSVEVIHGRAKKRP